LKTRSLPIKHGILLVTAERRPERKW